MINFILALFNVVSDKVNSSEVIGTTKSWLEENYLEAIIILVIGTLLGFFLNSAIRFFINFSKNKKDIPKITKKEDE